MSTDPNRFRISAAPNAYVSLSALALATAIVAGVALQLPPALALGWGALYVIGHLFNELVHHAGHAVAARQTGYPMRGIRLVYVLAVSLYPKDEPRLPARVHIRRALGGPVASALLSIAWGVVALAVRDSAPAARWLVWAIWFDCLLIFTLGAFLPLAWTDGGTLLHYWPRRNSQ